MFGFWIMVVLIICPNEDSFSNLEVVNNVTVLLDIDYACEKKGVGTIKSKLHDCIVKELSNVWYLLDLKKNLISLGALCLYEKWYFESY